MRVTPSRCWTRKCNITRGQGSGLCSQHLSTGARAAAASTTVAYFRRPWPAQTGCTAVEELQPKSTRCRETEKRSSWDGACVCGKQCLCRHRQQSSRDKAHASPLFKFAPTHALEQWEVSAAGVPRPGPSCWLSGTHLCAAGATASCQTATAEAPGPCRTGGSGQ